MKTNFLLCLYSILILTLTFFGLSDMYTLPKQLNSSSSSFMEENITINNATRSQYHNVTEFGTVLEPSNILQKRSLTKSNSTPSWFLEGLVQLNEINLSHNGNKMERFSDKNNQNTTIGSESNSHEEINQTSAMINTENNLKNVWPPNYSVPISLDKVAGTVMDVSIVPDTIYNMDYLTIDVIECLSMFSDIQKELNTQKKIIDSRVSTSITSTVLDGRLNSASVSLELENRLSNIVEKAVNCYEMGKDNHMNLDEKTLFKLGHKLSRLLRYVKNKKLLGDSKIIDVYLSVLRNYMKSNTPAEHISESE